MQWIFHTSGSLLVGEFRQSKDTGIWSVMKNYSAVCFDEEQGDDEQHCQTFVYLDTFNLT